MASATTTRGSGDQSVDALLAGRGWSQPGRPATLTYSFAVEDSRWVEFYGFDEPYTRFRPLDAEEQDAARSALDAWAGISGLRFVEVAEPQAQGVLRFGVSGAVDTAEAYFPGNFDEAGDVWLGRSITKGRQGPEPGTYTYAALLHEVGHALGLDHPHEAGALGVTLPAREDWIGASIMSYRAKPGGSVSGGFGLDFFPTSPMALDSAAIRYLYGGGAVNGGNTVYSFETGERVFETAFDTGGIDTIDWSNQTRGARIDLEPGAGSSLGKPVKGAGGLGNFFTTEDTLIENAIGGSGGDKIIGNRAANRLDGRGGNDVLSGEAGDDFLLSGLGKDRMFGEAGDDRFVLDFGKKVVDGGAGYDIVTVDGMIDDWRTSEKKGGLTLLLLDPPAGGKTVVKLAAVEQIDFDDGSLTLTEDGSRPPLDPADGAIA